MQLEHVSSFVIIELISLLSKQLQAIELNIEDCGEPSRYTPTLQICNHMRLSLIWRSLIIYYVLHVPIAL